MMSILALMYHDIFDGGAADSSGFPGGAAASYKLETDVFADHLDAIRAVQPQLPLYLTFDDGGSSAVGIAGLLEERGFRGHFFVTTDFLDTATFLSRADVRELARRGHVIGSHSCSHPTRMARCSRSQMLDEWRRSKATLEDVLGAPVDSASVPGGHYSRTVAETAAEAGLRTLFTSEPTTRSHQVDGCLVHGRFAIQRMHSPAYAAALASGALAPRTRQFVFWHVKKLGKIVAGDLYLKVRSRLLAD
jgi:peptidoglycan/xylan/chitin deacetylase (PgdA/CDA1 family)